MNKEIRKAFKKRFQDYKCGIIDNDTDGGCDESYIGVDDILKWFEDNVR